jgi:YidC/Oxa1 family membrane protein insertase
MEIWSAFVEVLRLGIFGLAQLYGGSLGWAIITAGLLARLLLLPLTVPLALRGRAHARRIAGLRPELERIRKKWKDDPRRMLTETAGVYERTGVEPVDSSVLKGSLVQAPILLGLFQSIRAVIGTSNGQGFLWLSSLTRPSVVIALLTACLAALGAIAAAPTSQPGPWLVVVVAVVTLIVVANVSAGFGLYVAASSLVGLLQSLIVRRIEAAESRA